MRTASFVRKRRIEIKMRAAKKKIVSLSLLLSLSMAGTSLSKANAISPSLSSGAYVPITMDDVRDVAKSELRNAVGAGRLSEDQARKFTNELDSASSLGSVEHTWAQLEARAQEAKALHPSLEHLLTTFSNKLDQWQKQ